MLNIRKLRAWQIMSGKSVSEISSILGIDRATLYRKMAGKSEFTGTEIIELKKILEMNIKDFLDIFFDLSLTEMQEINHY